MTDIDYLNARIQILEDTLSKIVSYNVAKCDQYNYGIPSESNFYNQLLSNVNFNYEKLEELRAKGGDA